VFRFSPKLISVGEYTGGAVLALVVLVGISITPAHAAPKHSRPSTNTTTTTTTVLSSTTTTTSTTVPSATTTTTSTTVPSATTTTTSTTVPSATGTVYALPSTIAADCSTDVAPALYQWISGLPNGTVSNPTVISFPSTACYEVEESIPIWQQSWIRINGNGAMFKALTNGTGSPYIGVDYGEPNGPHYPYYLVQNATSGSNANNSRAFLLIDDSTNIAINNVHYVGPNTCSATPYYNCYDASLESQAGFIVSGGSNISLSNSTISRVWGDCAQVGDFTVDAGRWLNGWTFANNHCDHLGRHGWSSNDGENFTVTDNTFAQIAYDAMDMEDDAGSPTSPVGCVTGCAGAGWANVTESNDTYSNVAFFSITVQCGAYCSAANITFSGNRYDSAPSVTVYGQSPDPYVENIKVLNNTWTGAAMSSYGDSVSLQLVTGGFIAGNTMPQECYDWSSSGEIPCGGTGPHTYQQPVAISVEGSTNVAVHNNNVEEAAQVLEVDSNNNGQSLWTGSPSSGITQCANSYGSKMAPQTQTAC